MPLAPSCQNDLGHQRQLTQELSSWGTNGFGLRDAGLLAYRELDEAIGLTETGADLLTDSRLGSNKQHLLVPLLRQSIYSRLAGYEDVNDAQRLAVDPAMRHVVGGRAAQADKEAASTSGVGRFETETLSDRRNLMTSRMQATSNSRA